MGGQRKGRFPEWSPIDGDSSFQGQIPVIPPFTSHSCERVPVGILLIFKLLWVQIPSEMLEMGNIIQIRHSYSSPEQFLGFYPEQNTPDWREFKATDKHQLLINGPWQRRKHQIPQKLFQDPIILPDNIICISSLLDPLFITQLGRGKTIFYVSQRSHELSWTQISATPVQSESAPVGFTAQRTISVWQSNPWVERENTLF